MTEKTVDFEIYGEHNRPGSVKLMLSSGMGKPTVVIVNEEGQIEWYVLGFNRDGTVSFYDGIDDKRLSLCGSGRIKVE